MEILIQSNGSARCVYQEAIQLSELGELRISRASHVEPDVEGRWWADMGPVGGERLGPFGQRSLALAAEQKWLSQHWLYRASDTDGAARSAPFGIY
jgi:hypothetical protein